MKTKEINVYVNEEEITNKDDLNYIKAFTCRFGVKKYKAKLIIEIPEKKVDLTWDLIESAIEGNVDGTGYCDFESIKIDLGF